jgi:hypothetical protein
MFVEEEGELRLAGVNTAIGMIEDRSAGNSKVVRLHALPAGGRDAPFDPQAWIREKTR